ncbi:hypothetical protein BYT27DRAFT_7164861 [Phlegmacium glaucopus]|nr:hypothetical protein BYT27DRAFT_7164861 [Phlegmacium glaucopus]
MLGDGSSRLPRRMSTSDECSSNEFKLDAFKRIIVCCDGTWQDGVSESRSAYTNVIRLARTINHIDERFIPPIPQIVFYQSGIGSEKNFYSEYIEGTTGSTLADKVEEAYGFIAHNYSPGDEISLFGFSRGAYTARMVAMFIGVIGVLDRRDMDNFAAIFLTFQKLGNCHNAEKRLDLEQTLGPWRNSDSRGKQRVKRAGSSFTVKCVGVWDTVGTFGLPEEISISSKNKGCDFGFPDRILGEHIERAYQALALNETRADFNCNKFEQTEAGRRNNQVLEQCWFAGCHADVGGGYNYHDLADLTLIWLCANIGDAISLDLDYLKNICQPIAPWGTQHPHSPLTGVFYMSTTIQRSLPSVPGNPITHESIHPSVLHQSSVSPVLSGILTLHPKIVSPLLPLEEEMKVKWVYDPSSPSTLAYQKKLKDQPE